MKLNVCSFRKVDKWHDFPDSVPRRTEGFKFLGVPIGTNAFIKDGVERRD